MAQASASTSGGIMAKKRSGLPAWFWLTGATLGAWAFYSNIVLDHNMPLVNAINANRKEFFGKNSTFLSYYHEDQAKGRPLVLLHSVNAAASSYEMRPFFVFYRGERPVYALDLPGFGFSERSNRDYSPQLYQNAIIDFLQGIVKEPADIIALSLSGEFAVLAAQQAPELFHSITLVSPTGLGNDDYNLAEARLLPLLNNPIWAQPLYDLLVTKLSLRYFLQKSFVGDVDEGMLDYAYDTAHQKGARFAPLSFIAGKLFSPHILEAYKSLKTPCLVLFDQDAYTTFESLAEVLNQNSVWRARKIPNTRGLPMWEQMGQVAEALDSFWEALSGKIT
jgi:pimeloyl-ACP methyl ester carboxylesterase